MLAKASSTVSKIPQELIPNFRYPGPDHFLTRLGSVYTMFPVIPQMQKWFPSLSVFPG